jgi:hypothetical protein
MKRSKTINLNHLADELGEEIEQMLIGIRGDSGASLWTTTMRPATRGGKCMITSASIEEPVEG